MEYKAKSILIARMPAKDDTEFRPIVVKLFSIDDPHMTEEFPTDTFEFKNVEKALIKALDIDYFPEGNDIVINNLVSVAIDMNGTILNITGNQG